MTGYRFDSIKNRRWPPSRTGMGRRFRMARLILNRAMNSNEWDDPLFYLCAAIWAIGSATHGLR